MKKKQAKKEIKKATKMYGLKTTAKILMSMRLLPAPQPQTAPKKQD